MCLFLLLTIICSLDYVGPVLIKFVSAQLFTKRASDIELNNCLNSLKQEMAEINMMENFSKYAKLQRKYNKLEDTLRKNVRSRLTSRLQIELLFTYGFRILNSLVLTVLLYMYWGQSITHVSSGTLWPLHYVLGWPHYASDNSISVPVWIMITLLVTNKFKKLHQNRARLT